MAKLIHLERDQVKAACVSLERLLAKDPAAVREMKERKQSEKAEKARRDREFAATQSKTSSNKQRAKQ
jgi:hypothetical protein